MQTLTTILRFRAMLLWVAGFIFLVVIICAISAAPQDEWNDPRLARVAAWLRGYPFYTPESFGIINGNIYPPLGALAFAPAAMFGDPIVAVIVGSMLSLLMNLSPVVGALILWSRGLQKSPQATEVMLWGVLYLGLLINIASTRNSLFAIHVDAPAIALMLWGVILYAKWWTTRLPWSMAMSAFFFGSVVWAKQLGVPLPFVFLMVTFLIGGLRSALVFSAWSLATTAFWLLVLTPIIVDWHTFFFNIWTIPAGHPWHAQVVGGVAEHIMFYLAEGRVRFVSEYWLLYLLMLIMALVFNVCAKQSDDTSLHFLFALGASSVIASLAMMPFALLGLVKVEGADNNALYSVQPVLLGLVLGSLTLAEIAKKAGVQWQVVAQSVICAWVALLCVAVLPGPRNILRYPFDIANAPMSTAYKESKSSKVWFPEYPLSSLLATGHLYHFSYGIFDRYLADKPVSKTQMWDGFPVPPFKLKSLRYEPDTIPPYLGLTEDTISHAKKDGPWMEMFVQNLPP